MSPSLPSTAQRSTYLPPRSISFDRLWAINPSTGKRCKKCGSIDLEGPGECHVTANYCWNCQDVNADGEADYSQRVQT